MNMTYKHFLLACSSSVIQYFNYAIFSLSALELSNYFMPGNIEKHKLLNFFAAIILTVLIRPVGSFIFGQIGDKIGRKLAIILSGTVSSLGALIVVFIPSYNSLGLLASILLIFSRMIFLSGLSGEIDGIRLYISENLSIKKQNLGNGLVTFFTQSGALLASLALYFLSDYHEGWQICFAIGGVVGVILSLLRKYIPETLEYVRDHNHPSEYYKVSFLQILYGQGPLLLKAIILSGTIGAMYQFFIIFFPIYLKVELNLKLINQFIPYYIFLYGLGGAIWGHMADKKGNRKIILTVITAIIFLLGTLFFIIENKHISSIPYFILIASFFLSGFSVPTQMLLKQKINVGIRYRIFSLGHSLGSVLISAPTSFVCTKIALETGKAENAIIYPFIMIALSFIIVNSLMKNSR